MLEIRHRNRLKIGNFDSKEEEVKNIGNKHGESVLDLNLELIQEDIEKVERKVRELKDKDPVKYREAIKKNLQVLVYLEGLKKKATGGNLEVMWFIEDDRIKTYPEFRDIPEMGIRCTDYINLSRKLYEINFKEVAELISLELMFRDLGESKDSIEEYLKEDPMVWIPPVNLLCRVDKDLYEKSRFMMIEDSPYRNHEKVMSDYFNLREFRGNRYADPVKFSVEYAMLLVLEDILEQTARVQFKIYGLTDHKIFLAPEEADAERLLEIIKQPVQVMAFGRKFIVDPEIKVY